MVGRSRAWVFTLNNYTEEDEVRISLLGSAYVVYGKEVGDSGTPHLQGYVYFRTQKSLKQLKKMCPTAHWEVRRGTHDQAREYCVKDGVFVEFGTPPAKSGGDAMSERIEKNLRMRTASFDELLTSGDIRFLDLYQLKKARLVYEQEGDALTTDGVRGLWIYGPPGTGKTHYARSLDDAYFVKSQNKWFDGYKREKTIVLDDLDKQGSCLGHYLKIWADKWACTGEVKGGTVALVHEKFVVTSNYQPLDLWPDDDEMRKAIERRFEFKNMTIKYT